MKLVILRCSCSAAASTAALIFGSRRSVIVAVFTLGRRLVMSEQNLFEGTVLPKDCTALCTTLKGVFAGILWLTMTSSNQPYIRRFLVICLDLICTDWDLDPSRDPISSRCVMPLL